MFNIHSEMCYFYLFLPIEIFRFWYWYWFWYRNWNISINKSIRPKYYFHQMNGFSGGSLRLQSKIIIKDKNNHLDFDNNINYFTKITIINWLVLFFNFQNNILNFYYYIKKDSNQRASLIFIQLHWVVLSTTKYKVQWYYIHTASLQSWIRRFCFQFHKSTLFRLLQMGQILFSLSTITS